MPDRGDTEAGYGGNDRSGNGGATEGRGNSRSAANDFGRDGTENEGSRRDMATAPVKETVYTPPTPRAPVVAPADPRDDRITSGQRPVARGGFRSNVGDLSELGAGAPNKF